MSGAKEGRFLIVREGDLIWVVQEGYFETELQEEFIRHLEAAITDACAAGPGTCQIIADGQKLEGSSLMGRVMFERFLRRRGKEQRMLAVMMPKSSKAGLILSVMAELLPSIKYRFVFSAEEALKALNRPPELLARFQELLAKGTWRGKPAAKASA